jgi:hypothetical protein
VYKHRHLIPDQHGVDKYSFELTGSFVDPAPTSREISDLIHTDLESTTPLPSGQ